MSFKKTNDRNEPMITYATQRIIKRTILYVVLAVVISVLMFPLFWMFSTSLRPSNQLYIQTVQLLPETLSLSNFRALLDTDFVTYYINSLIVSFGVVVLSTVLSTLGGYGLSRIDIPFKKWFARGVLMGYMFPPILLAIPMFILWRQIGLLNSYIGLILAETAITLPFSLWLMWKYFQTIPYSLEEAAQMMGASRFGAFYSVAVPMSKPGIIAVAVFSYAVSWNAYTIPSIILTDSSQWVLTVGTASFLQAERVLWGEIMAASVMIIIPAFIFVYFLQKYLLQGFRAGSVG